MAPSRSGRRGAAGSPMRVEPGVVVAAAAQAEPAGGLGDLPAVGPGAVVSGGVKTVAELAPGRAGMARKPRASARSAPSPTPS
jgi:hypothetical protein